MEKLTKYILIIGSVYFSIIYPSHVIFGVLIVVNIVDYITGILKAISQGEKISIDIAYVGMVKKFNKLFYVIVALSADILITYNFSPKNPIAPTSAAVITWLIVNEMISIIGNISNNENLKIPPALMKFLEHWKEN